MSEEKKQGGLAAFVVRLSGLWLLVGAIAKLTVGSPKDLPPIVLDMTPFGIDLTFHLVIAVEFAVALLAFLRPRSAWWILVLIYVFFDYILSTQIAAGDESCGCFGGGIKVSPWIMLAIDSVLLLALLVTQPWKIKKPGASFLLWLVLAAIAACLPWVFSRSVDLTDVEVVEGDGVEEVAGRYVVLEPEKWIDQMIYDVTDLTTLVNEELFPAEGKVVLWRQGCDHCAEHLQTMTQQDDGSLPILLIQLMDDLDDSPVVLVKPSGAHVTEAQFPEALEVMVQTPWELVIEGGIITRLVSPDDLEAGHDH